MAFAVAASPAPLRSQACAGFPSLRETHVNVAAHAASYTYATALGASVASGGTAFGVLGVGRTRDDELDASTLDLSFDAGADLTLGPRRGDAICPMVGVVVSLGPSDFLLQPDEYRRVAVTLGFDAAAVVLRSRGSAVFLTWGVRVVRLSAKVSHPGDYGYSRTGHDIYEVVGLGASVTLRDALTVRAEIGMPLGLSAPDLAAGVVAAPFGRTSQEIAAALSVGVGLGRRRAVP